jgi:hypothetical protein
MAGLHVSEVGTDRRTFIKALGATAVVGTAAVAIGSIADPAKAATDISGKKSGTHAYSDDMVVPKGKTLTFDPDKNTTLKFSGDLTVRGTLRMKPANRGIKHEIRFTNGGTLWVLGAGQLKIKGTNRAPWNRTGNSDNWASSDLLKVTPVAKGDYTVRNFNKGGNVPSTNTSHGTYKAEVFNLTRNVVIRGTADKPMEQIHVMSSSPQTIKYAVVRYAGITNEVGKYPIHFHFCHGGSRGSILQGVVVRDSNHHGYAIHASHGVTLKGCIAYDVIGDAFWWDLPPEDDATDEVNDTNDIVIDRCLAVEVRTSDSLATTPRELTGFLLGGGSGNVIRYSVASAIRFGANSSAFHWPSQANGVPNEWVFENCRAHNNETNGIFVWQNTASTPHFIDNYLAFHNGQSGIDHGAYNTRGYHYRNSKTVDNAVDGLTQHAQCTVPENRLTNERLSFEKVVFAGSPAVTLTVHSLPCSLATLYYKCTFDGAIEVDDLGLERGWYDFVESGVEPSDFDIQTFHPDSLIRVQRSDGTAYRITSAGGVETISAFWDGWNTLGSDDGNAGGGSGGGGGAPPPGNENPGWEPGCGNQ